MKILVATDFSPEATEAGRVAGDLARALNASLRLVHVIEPRSIYPLESNWANLQEGHEAYAANRLSREAAALGFTVCKTDVINGEPLAAITAFVKADKPDLVVVGACGAHGKSSFRDHAEKLALTLPCAVLVVRPLGERLRFALANKNRPRIFLALDRSSASTQAIDWVHRLRARLPCDVIVGHYYDPKVEHERLGIHQGDTPFTGDQRVVSALERELRETLANLEGDGELTFHCEPRVGLTAVDLLGTARAANADMIVIGSHRRGKLQRLLHGSVARDVLRHSDVPVVCVGAAATIETTKHEDNRL